MHLWILKWSSGGWTMSESDADPSVPCGRGGRQQFISHRSRWLVVLLQFLSCLSSTLSTTDINGTCGQVECLCSRKWGSGSSANCFCLKINLLEDSKLSLFIWWPIRCLVYLIRTDLSNELGMEAVLFLHPLGAPQKGRGGEF